MTGLGLRVYSSVKQDVDNKSDWQSCSSTWGSQSLASWRFGPWQSTKQSLAGWRVKKVAQIFDFLLKPPRLNISSPSYKFVGASSKITLREPQVDEMTPAQAT